MSGTGKSTALHQLGRRGHRVVDTDYGHWSHWIILPGGSMDWVWREPEICDERALVLHHLATVEPLLRKTATAEIDATAHIGEVVRQLEELALTPARSEKDGTTR